MALWRQIVSGHHNDSEAIEGRSLPFPQLLRNICPAKFAQFLKVPAAQAGFEWAALHHVP
jgi:hypothetical protein